MTIRALGPGALASSRAADRFVTMRRELDDMQRRLATGKIADSYGGLGFERRSSLDVRGKMAMLSGYARVIEDATLRMKVMAQSAERLDGMGRETRSDLMSPPFDIGSDGRSVPQRLAEQRLREALDHLNGELNGRFLFAGRNSDAPPVESFDLIMNGDATRAGLRTVIDERTAAEVGPDGLGRLRTTVVPPAAPATVPHTVQVSGNAGSIPFGFELISSTSSSSAIVATTTAGPPEQVSLAVNSLPAPNASVQVVLADADGNRTTIELKALASVPAGETGAFAIGADEATTAANLNAALRTAIRDKATAVLKPRAAMTAAEAFFAGSTNTAPERIAAPSSRLTIAPVGTDRVRLDGSLSDFGFEILNSSAGSTGNITTNFTAASVPTTPESVTFRLTAPMSDGDTITVDLRDRNGMTHSIVLTGRTTPDPTDPTQFEIGTVAATISGTNGLEAAFRRTIEAEAAQQLGAEDFDNSRPTVIWYKGDDDTATYPNARDTTSLRVDATQTVGTGARANEDAIKSLLAPLGVLAAVTFTDTPAERERYVNVMSQARNKLSPPYGAQRLEEVVTDFGAAMATMDGAKQRHSAATNMLQDTLDHVEQASTEETAAAMLNLQTRLQASYQTTAMLSQLSLVNYL